MVGSYGIGIGIGITCGESQLYIIYTFDLVGRQKAIGRGILSVFVLLPRLV